MRHITIRRRHTHRSIAIAAVVIAVMAIGIIIWSVSIQSAPKQQTQNSDNHPTETPSLSKVIHVSAMGDMLAHDTIMANAKTAAGYDFGAYFERIRPAYQSSDIVFCNQEGLSAGDAYGISGYPSFNAPTSFAAGLQSGAGCNMINLANNHMGDKGVEATNATIDVWSGLKPLVATGANVSPQDQEVVPVVTVKGVKIALVSFADFNNNTATPAYSVNNYHDEALVRRLIAGARSAADIVMVSMHWGTEDAVQANADQTAQVALLASLGVDMVIGTGPHVLQRVDTITRGDGNNMTVWYSIGNMLSSQLQIDQLVSGIAGFDIVKTASGDITINNLSFIPTYMHYEWTAEQKANGDYLSRKNAMLYLLKDAEIPLSRSLITTTIGEQRQYIIDTLGPLVTVK